MKLPFFSRYPYTNFEQLNIDWLLTTVSEFDARIKKNEEDINTLNGRVDTLEGRVDNHDIDIDDLKRRMSTAEEDIDSLEDRMSAAEGTISDHGLDISDLKDRMTAAEGDITNLENFDSNMLDLIAEEYDESVTYEEGQYAYKVIDGVVHLYRCLQDEGSFPTYWEEVYVCGELENHMSYIKSDRRKILNMETLIASFNNVTANPGGTGETLNTIQIGHSTYVIPSGGGSGSSVTPNPTGVATDTLNTVDIDGTIYAMPADVEANPLSSGTEDLTKIKVGSTTYDVQHLTVDNTLDDTSSNPIANDVVATAINDINDTIDSLGTVVNGVDSGSSYLSYPGFNEVGKVDITPGTWLIVSNYGLSPINGATLQNVHTEFMACTDKTDISHTKLPVDDEKMFKIDEGVLTYTMTNLLTVDSNTSVYFGFLFGNNFGTCGKKNNGIIAIKLK